MNCRICKIKCQPRDNDGKGTGKVTSIFDHESIVCGNCAASELAVKANSDPNVRDTVHFAYIINNFSYWRSVVLLHKEDYFAKAE